MNKKVSLRAFFCTFFLLIVTTTFAEDTVLKQFQTFKWKPVARAKKYEVLVQQKKADGTWTQAAQEITKNVRVEMLLYPGDYRVSISAFNVLGKKASSSPWIDFVILNETEPYLLPSIFTKDDRYNDFVLRRTQTVTQAVTDDNDDIVATENSTLQNSGILTVSGRNIFFPETTFTLIPIANEQFPAYMDKRPEVNLPVAVRDREQNQLEVTVDWTKLYAGYYRFEVKNPSGETDSSTVLVLPEQGVSFVEKSFDYNRRYKVCELPIMRQSQPTAFVVRGIGFQADSVFSFEPSTGIPYPFASTKECVPVAAKVTTSTCHDADDGELDITLEVDALKLETGYYRLTSRTLGLADASINLLVEITLPPEQIPEIKKIKTKVDKSDKLVQFIIEGARLSSSLSGESIANDSSAVLVAPCDENGVNKRIPLMLNEAKKNGKKITFDADSDMLTGGTYALMLETPVGMQIAHIELDSKTFAVKILTLTESQAEESFLRSETLGEPVVKKSVAPTPAIDSIEYTAAANAAAFLDASKWKQNSDVRLFCYEKEINNQKRLAMRFSGIRGSWSCFENTSEDAIKLLQSGTGVRITVLNDSESARDIELCLHVTKQRNGQLNNNGRVYYTITTSPLSEETFSIPYRDFTTAGETGSGVFFSDTNIISEDFDSNRIKGIQIHPTTVGKQRLEITELSVFDDTLPAGSQPFYNDHWVGFYDDENISLDNINNRFALRLTSPGATFEGGAVRQSYTALFSNFSTVLANELRGAEGIRFNVSSDRKADWTIVLVVKNDVNKFYEQKFRVLPNENTVVAIPYANFGTDFDSSKITGLMIKRYVTTSDNSGAAVFTNTIQLTEMTAYGNGKKMLDDTYVAPVRDGHQKAVAPTLVSDPNVPLVDPILFTEVQLNAHASFDTLVNDDFSMYSYGLELRVLDFNWYCFDLTGEFDSRGQNFDVRLIVQAPIKKIRPYIGLGCGYSIRDNSYMYVPTFVGATFFEHLDIRYSCYLSTIALNDSATAKFFEDSVSIGLKFRLRKPHPVTPQSVTENSSATAEPATESDSTLTGQPSTSTEISPVTDTITPVKEN